MAATASELPPIMPPASNAEADVEVMARPSVDNAKSEAKVSVGHSRAFQIRLCVIVYLYVRPLRPSVGLFTF